MRPVCRLCQDPEVERAHSHKGSLGDTWRQGQGVGTKMRKDKRDKLTVPDLKCPLRQCGDSTNRDEGMSELCNILPSLGNRDSAEAGRMQGWAWEELGEGL